MAQPELPDLETFAEKIATYLETHSRILKEFENSLGNAQHFIELANLAMEKEPESTVEMLEQVREIDLLSHLSTQFQAFQEVGDLLPGQRNDPMISLKAEEMEELRERYEALLRDAEKQQEALGQMLEAITSQI